MNVTLLETMRAEGALRYPEEACGLVVALENGKSVAVPCANISTVPKLHFQISPVDYVATAKLGKVIGVWHTHCEISPSPSDADKASCEMLGMPWYILSVFKNEVGEFAFSEMTITAPSGFEMPYLGRPYVSGVFDCYSILLDYYKREYGIRMNDYPRIKEDGSSGIAYFTEKYEDEGFVRLIGQEPKPGDVFFIQMADRIRPDHLAVYLGDEMILHHNTGRLSKRDLYGGYWVKHTVGHFRHKSKC